MSLTAVAQAAANIPSDLASPIVKQQPPEKGLKRKMSLDGGEAIDGKRAKCTSTANGGGGGGGGIATNTIMITNNYSKNGMTPTSTTTTTTSKSSKITILTHDDDDGEHDPADGLHHRPMVVDQINICINNHFSSDAALLTTTTSATAKMPDLIKIQKKPPPAAAEPTKPGYEAVVVKEEKLDPEEEGLDAVITIKQEPIDMDEPGVLVETQPPQEEAIKTPALQKFSIGEEVLVPRQPMSDRFYLGILTVMRDDQCLVQFEDGTNCWSALDEVRRLLRQSNTIYCVICKQRDGTDTDRGRSSTVCLACGRAYHRACIQAEVELLGGNEGEKISSQNINCLRCYKRAVGIDQVAVISIPGASSPDDDSQGTAKTQDDNKAHSSNTGNTTSSVMQQQVEIGTPSMDWFTKEHKGDEAGGPLLILGLEEPDEEDDADGDSEPKTEDEYFKYVNGRRLRKRQQKTNYATKPKRSLGADSKAAPFTFPSPSWSCSSSTCSTTSSSTGWCTSSVMSSFTGASPLFSLDELRWAFLPKSRKSKKRNAKKAPESGRQQAAAVPSLKVPYERAGARVSSQEGDGRELERDLKWNSIYETKSRMARGDKYKVRGKRQDHSGTVQYLIEWESGAA